MRAFSPITVVAVLGLAVSGCISESADIGRPPPVVLETPRIDLNLSSRSPRDRAARAEVHRAIVAIADGDIQSVRIQIYARSGREREELRRMLVGIGADPARVTTAPGRWPSNRLLFTRVVAETTPCRAAIVPVDPDDPLPSLMSLARCTQTNNLANMLVDPGDLVAPPRLSAEDGQFLVDGVQSWRADRSKKLPGQDIGLSSGGSGFGGAPVASASPATLPTPAAVGTTAPVAAAPAAATPAAGAPTR